MPGLLRSAASEWMEDKAPRLAAALSYYALFSVTPILLISIALAGVIFGEEAARGEILDNVQGVVGTTTGRAIEEMIASAGRKERSGTFAVIVGFALLLFGASGVFNQLKETLNTIWGVPPTKGGGILRIVRERFLSFAMVMTVGFLLLMSLIVTAVLSAAGKYMENRLPGGEALWQFLNLGVSLAVITVLFAMIFRYVPDNRVPWRDVWIGALFTAILFTLGKFGIGIYIGRSSTASAFGAAGSIVIILIWIYYSSMLVFFGAEFTEVYARRRREGKQGARPRRASLEPIRYRQADVTGDDQEVPRRRGGAKAAVLSGCGGLLVGILLGVVTAVIGVAVTAVRSAVKKWSR